MSVFLQFNKLRKSTPGGERLFEPEEAEMRLHGSKFQQRQSLSLVPMEREQWKEEETREKACRMMVRALTDGVRPLRAWVSIPFR